MTEIDIIPIAEANALIHGRHYLGAKTSFASICFATRERDAVAIFAPPVAATINRNILELARLWQSDDTSRPLSQFVGRVLRTLKRVAPRVVGVIAYADPAQNHRGGIYVACNFAFLGERRATDHWMTKSGAIISAPMAYRQLGTKSRAVIARKRPSWRLIAGHRKLGFVFGLKVSTAEMLERMIAPQRRSTTLWTKRVAPRRCAMCGRQFAALRSDAKTCGDRCRKALQRQRDLR